ncbi:dihydrofolate reductase family protein [Streptomyces cavernicola]|uniref:Dihydrofolate reductase family protein n=1 Tax=Streptomyces cavernicola TaxID=3043613 RepID=A0ABT6SKE7_9ACTN|nr:dihydrofolate reductase family protein [Streptomyces sp. B-S-A6]MDI3408662.1 dihydrofolate reductase family protein [Streptomyces sp. B-S-A6]
MRKLSYLIATSIDGFIGDVDGEAEFFTKYIDEKYLAHSLEELPDTLPTFARRHFGIDDRPNRRYDTVLMGRATYEVGLPQGFTNPYAHLKQYVVSRSMEEAPAPEVEVVAGDVVAKVRELKRQDGLDIWLCGGADLAGQLLDEMDELVIKTYPCFLGSGMPLTRAGFEIRDFALESVKSFDGGVVITTYSRKR